MNRKIIILGMAGLFILPSLSEAGIKDKIKGKVKSAQTSTANTARNTAGNLVTAPSKVVHGGFDATGLIVDKAGTVTSKTGSAMSALAKDGTIADQAGSHASQAGSAMAAASKNLQNTGQKIDKAVTRTGNKIKKG